MVPMPNITATPQTGYYFSGWTGEGIADANFCLDHCEHDRSKNDKCFIYSKKFLNYLQVVTPDDAGQVTGTKGIINLEKKQILLLSATLSGYSFLSWSGDINSTENPLILNIDSNLSLTANFSLNTYSLEISAGIGGSVSGDGNFTHGTLAAINATPDTGYSFYRLVRGWGLPIPIPYPPPC